ncbi:hypothetical protein BYT27DRAFT_7258897 [Phlegmacium glaucopus]|nr:hypothetical protein BYT27DRAFT_7258897 [Phlegmacium glaucopus]
MPVGPQIATRVLNDANATQMGPQIVSQALNNASGPQDAMRTGPQTALPSHSDIGGRRTDWGHGPQNTTNPGPQTAARGDGDCSYAAKMHGIPYTHDRKRSSLVSDSLPFNHQSYDAHEQTRHAPAPSLSSDAPPDAPRVTWTPEMMAAFTRFLESGNANPRSTGDRSAPTR